MSKLFYVYLNPDLNFIGGCFRLLPKKPKQKISRARSATIKNGSRLWHQELERKKQEQHNNMKPRNKGTQRNDQSTGGCISCPILHPPQVKWSKL